VKKTSGTLIVCLFALVLTSGCSGPLAALGDSETDRAIESAAADPSFPSAAEAGLASGSL
jgi:hypothetical protein